VKVYILGPMSGYPDFNRPAFREAAAELRSRGFDVVCPAELDDLYDEPNHYTGYYVRDIPYLLQCDIGVALPGWRKSKGASLEAVILNTLERPVLRYPDMTAIVDLPSIIHP